MVKRGKRSKPDGDRVTPKEQQGEKEKPASQPQPTEPLWTGPRFFLLLASFLSGVAALNYELLWIRELTLVAGSTQAAISAVLSIYFLGLALGNYIAGRIVGRLSRPLLIYVVAELIIGVWALLFYPLLSGLDPFYTSIYLGLEAGSPLIHILRLTSAAMLLLIPATCMGATLPLLAQWGAKDLSKAPRWSAALYGVNTLGAMIGTFATGFFLIEHLGVSWPLRLTALLNLGCIFAVLPWLKSGGKSMMAAIEEERHTERLSRTGVLLLLSFGVLGFANVAIEVIWTRYFAMIFQNDTYIFSTILLMYLFGVGAGSLLGQRFLSAINRPIFVLGILQLISASVTLLMTLFVPPIASGGLQRIAGFGGQMQAYFMTVGFGTLIQTLCMGASFPVLVRAVMTHHTQTGGIVGRALALNTLGGVIGAAVGGFVLLESFGLGPALFFTAGLTFLVGVALVIATGETRSLAWIPIAGLGFPVAVALTMNPPRLPQSLLELQFPSWAEFRILDTRPSVHGTVTITEEREGIRKVWINSTWVASERAHLAFGYAPWLLHTGPVESALGICCGTGRTFGALLNVGITDLDLVDINESVIDLSAEWMARSNHGVLTDPRARIIIDDGRNFVRYTDKTYDLITLEPLQMFQKGVVYFYTKEFYEQARERMNVGGVICQWIPLYLMSEHEFLSVVKTFVGVFPNSLLWGRRPHSLVLLGYNLDGTYPEIDEREVFARMARPELAPDLAQEEMIEGYDPLIYTLTDGGTLAGMSRAGEIYTDDKPRLEFTAPRANYAPERNLKRVMDHLRPLDQLYDLPDAETARQMEQIRTLSLQMSAPKDVRARIQRTIDGIREELYSGADSSGAASAPTTPTDE